MVPILMGMTANAGAAKTKQNEPATPAADTLVVSHIGKMTKHGEQLFVKDKNNKLQKFYTRTPRFANPGDTIVVARGQSFIDYTNNLTIQRKIYNHQH